MTEKSPMKVLRSNFAKPGTVEWIGLRPERRAVLNTPATVKVLKGLGLEGDRAAMKAKGGKRQVTLIQAEHIEAMAGLIGVEKVDPQLLRRNIVVRGINLQAMKEHKIRIGTALLEITDACNPCSRMEENLGMGGYNAMRGHGGWCAIVLEGGEIGLGDSVMVDQEPGD